jgi:AraC-like DNA-binding protein
VNTPPGPDNNDDLLTSHWPLPSAGIRQVTPHFLLRQLTHHPLTQDLYPLALGYYPNAYRHRMLRRAHDNYLLIYCTAGSGELTTAEQNYSIGAGDLMLLPPGLAHSYRAAGGTPWTIFWIHFNGLLGASYTDIIAMQGPVKSIGVSGPLIAQFEKILSLRKRGLTLHNFIHIAGRIKALLTDIACSANTAHSLEASALGISQAIDQMHKNLQQDLDLDHLAALANLSKFHFIRRFRAATGHTPIQHFIHLKMEHACALLDSSDAAIKSVASSLGYNDPLYFSRQFKKIIGISPQEYRRSHAV